MKYDNTCKYLAEKYPNDFASWVLGESLSSVEVLKTELSLDPISADSVTFLRTSDQILHLEFQVKVAIDDPMPLRMLNYWVRLYWKYRMPVTQVLIWLKQTSNPGVFETEFSTGLTRHGFQVIRIWEQSPEPLLQNPGLVPLATLAAAPDAAGLLNRVAQQVSNIDNVGAQQDIAACTQILAGLRFDKKLIQNLFRREIMRESVIYQDILEEGEQKGRQEGRQEGRQQEALGMVIRQLTRRFGTLSEELPARMRELSLEQLEDLGEALLDFSNLADLVDWLQSR
jgi:predicted transposase/invertase (TIGR01784 family)